MWSRLLTLFCLFLSLVMCLCVCVWVWTQKCRCPGRPADVGPPRTGVMDSHEHPDLDAMHFLLLCSGIKHHDQTQLKEEFTWVCTSKHKQGKSKWDLGWDKKVSKPSHSDILPLARLHLLNFSRYPHQPETIVQIPKPMGGSCHSNSHKLGIQLSHL